VKDSSGTLVHVGTYLGNNQVIHARGTKYGVVKTELLSSFTVFGRNKLLKQDILIPTFAENMRLIAAADGIDYSYWAQRKNIDPYFEAYVKKQADYIRRQK
jgi:cell wall-associated NlpC family hydrolase